MNKAVSLWRIAVDTPDYPADDKSGAGAKVTGGRWNQIGVPVLYCSSSIALACLETVVHLNLGVLPLNRYLVEISVPISVWRTMETFDSASHVGWDAMPYGKVSVDAGTEWARSGRSVLLQVPSVIIPEEQNILINPLHKDLAKLAFNEVRKWTYDARL